MTPQDTPVHTRLWHRDFWLLAMASLVLTMSVYILLPVVPQWLMTVENFSPEETGLSMCVFGVGLYLFGAHCSWLVQRYRRNVVCMWAVIGIAVDAALLYYIDIMRSEFVEYWVIMIHRLLLGATFGLAQMVLSSTLIIDTCESFQRTAANHCASWFSRLGMAAGPLAGVLVSQLGFPSDCGWLSQLNGFHGVVFCSVGLALLALLLVKSATFPFRTPEDQLHFMSLDRFFLPHGTVLFLNLVLITTVLGLLLSLPLGAEFYGLVIGGFLLALLAQRFVFPDAELKSEIVSGLILSLAALLVMLTHPESLVPPVLLGLGLGIIGSRFLLFFIKLSRHCQRGTSQSTYFLGWETGVSLGLGLGYGLFYHHTGLLLGTALVLTSLSLLMYSCFTHRWFLKNKNR